jgi:uncharacterized protein YabE (DUF348 family)
VLLVGFLVFAVFVGQDKPFITSKAVAEGKGLITVYADGQKKTFATNASTVKDALKQNNIDLGVGDVTEPAADSPINQPHLNVNVYRAYPAVIIDGEKTINTLSGYRSAKQIVEAAGVQLFPEDKVSMDRNYEFASSGPAGQRIIIERATPVQLTIGQKTFDLRTWKSTVGELLQEKGIQLMPQDEISFDKNETIYKGMKIVLSKINQDIIQVTEALEPDVQYKDDPNQPVSYQKVLSEGKPGEKLVSYLVNQRDGITVGRQAIESKIIIPAEPKVIARGTLSDSLKDNASLLYKLRMCETGGRYDANTGNGYYGAYQFSAATWNRWNTGYARADLAPPAVQDEYVLKNAKASKGGFWSQHPGCSTKLGLPKFPF